MHGATCAQLFVGRTSLLTDVYGMKRPNEFVHTLQDNIRQRGAPTQILSDNGQNQIGKAAKTILHSLMIGDWQSEVHHQRQNYTENRYRTVKRLTF